MEKQQEVLFSITSTKFVQKLRELNKVKNIYHINGVLQGHERYARPYGTIQNHKGPYGTIQDYLGPFRTLQDHIGPCRVIQGHTGLYGAIKGHTGP